MFKNAQKIQNGTIKPNPPFTSVKWLGPAGFKGALPPPVSSLVKNGRLPPTNAASFSCHLAAKLQPMQIWICAIIVFEADPNTLTSFSLMIINGLHYSTCWVVTCTSDTWCLGQTTWPRTPRRRCVCSAASWARGKSPGRWGRNLRRLSFLHHWEFSHTCTQSLPEDLLYNPHIHIHNHNHILYTGSSDVPGRLEQFAVSILPASESLDKDLALEDHVGRGEEDAEDLVGDAAGAATAVAVGVEEVHQPGLERGELAVELRGHLQEEVVLAALLVGDRPGGGEGDQDLGQHRDKLQDEVVDTNYPEKVVECGNLIRRNEKCTATEQLLPSYFECYGKFT